MKANHLLKLTGLGQSIWLDFISRQLIDSGELKRLIDQDGLRGMTSNPAIFDKAISGSRDYDDDIRARVLEVNPHLAHDTPGTIAAARRLWAKLDRPTSSSRCRPPGPPCSASGCRWRGEL